MLAHASDEPAAPPLIEKAVLTPDEVEFFKTLGYTNYDFEVVGHYYRYKWHWREPNDNE
jgi:hypothetical protein